MDEMLRLFFSQRAIGRENEDSEFGTEKSKEEEQKNGKENPRDKSGGIKKNEEEQKGTMKSFSSLSFPSRRSTPGTHHQRPHSSSQ
jgi:hypothetical protein